MNKDSRELAFRMEDIAQRCICAVEYFDAVTGKDSEFWSLTQNCFGEMACLYWCHLFKSYKDDLHYKKLFGNDALIHLGQTFSYDNVRARLLKSISLSEKEYDIFRKEVITFRDTFVAHKEAGQKAILFPNIDLIKNMVLELRNIFRDLYDAAKTKRPMNTDIQRMVTFYKYYPNEWLLRKCKNELGKAKII